MPDFNDMGEALSWDDTEVEDSGGRRALIPEGTYNFMVASLVKKRFEGSAKTAPCPKAELHLSILMPDGSISDLTTSMLLSTKGAWRVARFFECLGFPKDTATGKVQVAWNRIEGMSGWLKLGVREYESNGQKRKTNDVLEWLAPSDAPQAAAPASATACAQAAMPVPAQPQQPHQAWSM